MPARLHSKVKRALYPLVARTPAPVYVKLQWWRRFRRPLNLANPRTYNERLQWLKVYGERRPDIFGDVALARQCADKVAVRDYVARTIGEEYLVERLGTYNSLEEVPFEDLPDQFVIRASHDSGSTIIVTDKRSFLSNPEALDHLRFRLKIDFGLLTKEWVYTGLRPRVIVDKLLSGDHRRVLWDYKVFVFRGEPRVIGVDIDRFGDHRRPFYTPDWRKLDLSITSPSYGGEVPRPSCLPEMLEKSSLLARPFRHARVDWYVLDGRLLFGEITFFNGSGFSRFSSYQWELVMGSWLAW